MAKNRISVSEVNNLYSGRGIPGMNGPDGLVTAKQYKKELFDRIPQDPDNGPGGPNPGANGDVGDGWLRGMGSKRAEGNPCFVPSPKRGQERR